MGMRGAFVARGHHIESAPTRMALQAQKMSAAIQPLGPIFERLHV